MGESSSVEPGAEKWAVGNSWAVREEEKACSPVLKEAVVSSWAEPEEAAESFSVEPVEEPEEAVENSSVEPAAEVGNSWVEESAVEAENSWEELAAEAANSSVEGLAVQVLEAVRSL